MFTKLQGKISFDTTIEPFTDEFEGYDAIEIHPCCYIDEHAVEVCEDKDADFYSVYLHKKVGGVECIADCKSRERAEALSSVLMTIWRGAIEETRNQIVTCMLSEIPEASKAIDFVKGLNLFLLD